MSNRPRAVDFLNDEDEEPAKEIKNISDEEPVCVSEAESEVESGSGSEKESEQGENVETLPSGAISKGIKVK